MQNYFKIRVRAIIINSKDELMGVKHRESDDFLAIPGGHLEFGEDPKSALVRELYEEFNIQAKVGELVYVNTFVQENAHSIELFFNILNANDFLNFNIKDSSHGYEINKIVWLTKESNEKLLPQNVLEDFKNSSILDGQIKFI